MGYIVHLIIFIIVLTICLLIIKKSRVINKRRWYGISFVIAFILFILSGSNLVENTFVTFSSPESAFRYTNSANIIFVVEGEESTLVVGDEGGNILYDAIPKAGIGWKLGSGGDLEKIIATLSNSYVSYRLEQYVDSEDYYITVSDFYGSAIDVADNLNSEFYRLKQTSNISDEAYYTYYAYVHDIDDEYTLIVNGEQISVFDEQN